MAANQHFSVGFDLHVPFRDVELVVGHPIDRDDFNFLEVSLRNPEQLVDG